jgi:hypothetical protein
MKHVLKTLLLAGLLSGSVLAEQVGTGFSYQGELLDNGSPANGEYDIQFLAYDQAENGTQGITTPTFLNVDVSNGLFSIPEVDFGEDQFIGDSVWVELAVRKSSEGGNYTPLSPRQKIAVAPYAVQSRYAVDAYSAFNAASADHATTADSADNANHAGTADVATEAQSLAAGNANMADVLQFDGVDWIPVPMNQINQSPWSESGADVYRTEGEVGIGLAAPASTLHVHSNDSYELTRFDGGARFFNTYYEEGISRGYVGSYQETEPGTSDADFDLGTSATNSSGALHLTTRAIPRVSIDENGLTGINSTSPQARLHVDSEANEAPLRVKYNGATKLWIRDDGNTHVYGQLTAEGETQIKGQATVKHHMTQDIDRHGLVKYMLKVDCDMQNPSIISQVNNTNTPGLVTVENAAGYCKLSFPTDVEDRFVMVSADTPFGAVNAGCGYAQDNHFRCGVFNTIIGSSEPNDRDITVLVY